MIQSIWLPGRLPSMNEIIEAKATKFRGSKQGKRADGYSALKKLHGQRIALLARTKLKPVRKARIEFIFREPNRRRDPDGFVSGGTKIILDGLVMAGILPDDGWDEILSFSASWSVAKNPGVIITIQDVSL